MTTLTPQAPTVVLRMAGALSSVFRYQVIYRTFAAARFVSGGTGRLVRIRQREADNNWEDVTPTSAGYVEVAK